MTLEPRAQAPRPSEYPRTVTRQLTDRARRMTDAALDRVFDEPFEIRSADDFERVMGEHHVAMSFATAGALAGFVERALPVAKLSTKAGKKIPMPAIKYTLAAIPIAMQLGNSVRHAIPLPVNDLVVAWTLENGDLVISVSDGGSPSTTPHAVEASRSQVSGRGLGIVDALAERWWVEGKLGQTTVHVRMPL